MHRWLGLVGMAMLVGCSSNTLEDEEVPVAWEATSAELTRTATEAPLVGFGADGTFALGCLDGGTIDGTGEFDAEANLEDLSAVASFAYELQLDGCAHDGVVVDGFLELEGAAGASVTDLSAGAAFVWTGNLDYTGEVEGSCVIDVEAMAFAGVGSGASASFEGSFCGDDVSLLAVIR